jgi:hypothetical protein
MLAALFTLYPFLFAFVGIAAISSFALSATVNILLTMLCLALYTMIPMGSFDPWIDTFCNTVRSVIPKEAELIFKNLEETFPYHETSPPEKALYLWHPHALLCVAPSMHALLRGHKVVSISAIHYVPVLRDLCHYFHTIPSNYEVMKKTLETESISVIPGGVREGMKQLDKSVLRVSIRNRTGIFRLALETGTPIVPVLTYGETELFPIVDNPILRTFNEWLYRNTKLTFPMPSFASLYRWGQLAYEPLSPVRSYAGKPIPTSLKQTTVTDTDIDEIRTKYLAEVQTLFETTAPPGMRLLID